MKELTARAMAILTGNESMVERLHVLEISKGYCAPASNIAKLFGNDSIKGFYGVPEDGKKISRWTYECKQKLDLVFTGEDHIRQCIFFGIYNVDEIHELDWKYFMNRSALDFSYDWKKDKPENSIIDKFGSKKKSNIEKKDFWVDI